MKRVYLFCFCALQLAWGCSDEEPAATIRSGEGVAVDFRLEAAVETGTELEPMTRAADYTNWMFNKCRMLVLKHVGQQWIVDALPSVPLDASQREDDELKLTGGLPPCTFRFEMRPGDYRIVAVLNSSVADWNDSLTPGTVVADAAAPEPVPELLKYRISSHNANPGFRMLNREVFVAVADFTVPKSGDLHAQPLAPVTLQAERRVCKVRFLLKNVTAPQGTRFRKTAYTFTMTFRGVDGPLAGGIDALGDTWYGGDTLYELPWRLSTVGAWHPSQNGNTYQLCQHNSTVFSPFLFVDPTVADFPVEVTIPSLTGQAGETPFHTVRGYTLSLAANRITGIVFQPTDQYDEDEYGNPVIALEVALDDKGVPEIAAALFDEYFEWNAPSN